MVCVCEVCDLYREFLKVMQINEIHTPHWFSCDTVDHVDIEHVERAI